MWQVIKIAHDDMERDKEPLRAQRRARVKAVQRKCRKNFFATTTSTAEREAMVVRDLVHTRFAELVWPFQRAIESPFAFLSADEVAWFVPSSDASAQEAFARLRGQIERVRTPSSWLSYFGDRNEAQFPLAVFASMPECIERMLRHPRELAIRRTVPLLTSEERVDAFYAEATKMFAFEDCADRMHGFARFDHMPDAAILRCLSFLPPSFTRTFICTAAAEGRRTDLVCELFSVDANTDPRLVRKILVDIGHSCGMRVRKVYRAAATVDAFCARMTETGLWRVFDTMMNVVLRRADQDTRRFAAEQLATDVYLPHDRENLDARFIASVFRPPSADTRCDSTKWSQTWLRWRHQRDKKSKNVT